ncbi:MAG: DUF1552 domain-containing protein [Deltaproteobacteria bacterium]|nr:DUF1552 domain-containing protein [Nannocystaceae bacterium]
MTTPKLSRRHVLRGAAGFTLALPLLPSLQPRAARAGDPPFAANPRFIAFATEHGGVWEQNMYPAMASLTESTAYAGRTIRRGDLAATQAGGNASISPVLSGASDVLTEALVGKLNVLRGLDHPFYIGHHRGGHLGNYAENDGNGTDGQVIQAYPRPTIDQVMAWSSSFYPDLSSILERTLVVGDRVSWGWSSPESGTGSIQEMPAVFSSLELFNRIFVPMEDEITTRPPVVDRVLADYQSLRQGNRRLSATDRQRIDDHLERLDELQRKLAVQVSCGDVMPPGSNSTDEWNSSSYGYDPAAQRRFWQLVNDVIVAAFICGTSRIAVLRVTDHFSDFQGDWHQAVAHEAHALDGGAQATLATAHQRFFEDVFLDLAHKLDAVDEGSGPTLLDNSLMMWSQESGLYTHESVSQPVITFGSAAGFLKTGQYTDYRNLADDGMSGWGGGNQTLYPGLCYNQWLGTALRAVGVPPTEYESGDHGGYGEVYVGEGREQFYPSAVFDAAGDLLPWLEA